MKKSILLIIKSIITCLFIYLIIENVDLTYIIKNISRANWVWLIPTLILILSYLFIANLRLCILLRTYTPISVFEYLPKYLTSWTALLAIPGNFGDILSVGFFRKYGIRGSKGLAIYLVDKFIILWLYLAFGFVLLASDIPKIGIICIAVYLSLSIAFVLLAVKFSNYIFSDKFHDLAEKENLKGTIFRVIFAFREDRKSVV